MRGETLRHLTIGAGLVTKSLLTRSSRFSCGERTTECPEIIYLND